MTDLAHSSHPSSGVMRLWAFALIIHGFFTGVVSKVGNHRLRSVGSLALLQAEGGIRSNNGQSIFESGQDIELLCTLTDAGLNEGLKTSDLRFEIPSGDVVKPNYTSNNTTVSLIIVNATASASGRTKMTECRQKDPYVTECEANKGQTPPYRPGETETNITVKAQNVLGHTVFTYPFDHYRNIKIETLENVALETVDAETMELTWDIPLQSIFESGQDIVLLCTLTDAGLNEGLKTSDLRFEIPSGDVVKPNYTSNNTTVSLIIVNATASASGRTKMTECRQKDPNVTECEAKKGQTPPYRPGETETNITVKAQNVLGQSVFTYPFDHYRNIKIETLENVALETVDAETMELTWDIPLGLALYNVSIVHAIQLTHSWEDELHSAGLFYAFIEEGRRQAFQPVLHNVFDLLATLQTLATQKFIEVSVVNKGVANYQIPGGSKEKSWNYTLNNLIPNTNYEVAIRASVEGAEYPDLWSNYSMVEGKTMPKVPDRSPDVPLGSFHVERINDSRINISFYWVPLSDWEHYGDNFTYLVEGWTFSCVDNSTQEVQPSIVTNTSAAFEYLRTDSAYKFLIVSSNEMGNSQGLSIFEVDMESNRMPFPAIQRYERMVDGTYVLEWRALEEEKTTNFTVFWCLSTPYWPKCDSGIDWVFVSRNTTTFELKSNKLLKFAISANRENGSSGMGWDQILMVPDSGQNLPVVLIVVAVVIVVILGVSAVLGGKRLWRRFRKIGNVEVALPSAFSDSNPNRTEDEPNEAAPHETESVRVNTALPESVPGPTLDSPTTDARSPVQAYKKLPDPLEDPEYRIVSFGDVRLAPGEQDINYICDALEDEGNVSEDDRDDDSRTFDSDYNMSLVDDEEYMKKLGILGMGTRRKMSSTGYVQASGERTLHLGMDSEPETSPREEGRGKEEREWEYVQTAVSLEITSCIKECRWSTISPSGLSPDNRQRMVSWSLQGPRLLKVGRHIQILPHYSPDTTGADSNDSSCPPTRQAGIQPEGGIEDSNGQFIFESGEDIKLFCTLTEVGLSEGLTRRDLRFKTPSGDVVKPNSASNNTTVSLIIVNASANDSVVTVLPLELKSWRCWSKQLELLLCTWSKPENPVWTDYFFYIQTDGMKMAECRQRNATEDGKEMEICDLSGGRTPPYRPYETDMKMTVVAQNLLGNRTFTYPFDHYRNIKIEALEDVAVGKLGEETLEITWDLPAFLDSYNVSIIHNIQWVPKWKDELHFSGVRELAHYFGLEVT
ncbi:unnamed protein product [Darwinula stevensoni]|uniref:Fibronectin type-III domain-containing protein n=1 Tax=Darwinula stevensoni TaxID=69355 RepID=A0A7R9ADM3_9CRUS|nr:unnamed protein product [Darwinula stevensoni]CAG0901145.1 unnamed protein product [Darwinula stevensoni]